MARISIGETKWRVLRRLYLAGGSLPWEAVRGHRRQDRQTRRDLAEAGLVTDDGVVLTLTEAGRRAQELGEVEV